jgi:hypothetical protein
MGERSRPPVTRFEYSARDWQVGGAAASLYDTFATAGRFVFTMWIGAPRARRPNLRNARVVTGGFVVTGSVLGLATGAIAAAEELPDGGDAAAVFIGTFFGVLVLGGLIGAGFAMILVNYVERARDEVVRVDWLKDVGDVDRDKQMEAFIDSLQPVRRGHYYDEYFAARGRGDAPKDAHASARRRLPRNSSSSSG